MYIIVDLMAKTLYYFNKYVYFCAFLKLYYIYILKKYNIRKIQCIVDKCKFDFTKPLFFVIINV